jgi:hypothetical protein
MLHRWLGRAWAFAGTGILLFAASRAVAEEASPAATVAFPLAPPPPGSATAASPHLTTANPLPVAAPASAPPPAYYAPPPVAGQYEPRPKELPPPEPPRSDAKRARSVSITLSPVHLLFPIFELTVEARPVNHVGIAVVGGVGSIRPKGSSTSYAAQELGA